MISKFLKVLVTRDWNSPVLKSSVLCGCFKEQTDISYKMVLFVSAGTKTFATLSASTAIQNKFKRHVGPRHHGNFHNELITTGG